MTKIILQLSSNTLLICSSVLSLLTIADCQRNEVDNKRLSRCLKALIIYNAIHKGIRTVHNFSFYNHHYRVCYLVGKKQEFKYKTTCIPQPLYNSIFGVQANFSVSSPNRVIARVKCIVYIGKGVDICGPTLIHVIFKTVL